jgi:hypothetical protein
MAKGLRPSGPGPGRRAVRACMRTVLGAGLCAVASIGLHGRAAGAEAPAEASPPESPPVRIEMKEVEIRGEVERPDVFYIIPRKQARMELAPLSKDYRDEILEPLLPGPFERSVKGK